MSQHHLVTPEGYALTVGWDQPLMTFFAFGTFNDEDTRTFEPIYTVDAFVKVLADEFGVILADETIGDLIFDRDLGRMS